MGGCRLNLLAPPFVLQSAATLCGGAPAVTPQVTVVTGDALDEGGIVGRGPLYVAPDGHVFYLDIQDARLKEFDAQGGFVQTLGRPGEGPGEFQNPTGVGGRVGVVWVREGATGRLTTFWRTGELAETVAVPAGPGTAVFGPVGRSGDLLATRAVPLDGETRSVQSSFVRLDRDGRVRGTIAVFGSRQDLVTIEDLFGPGSRYTGLAIFSDAPIIRTSPGAEFLVQVERPAPERGQDASFRIVRIEVESGSRASVDVPYEPVRVTDDLIDATSARTSRRWSAERRRPGWTFPWIARARRSWRRRSRPSGCRRSGASSPRRTEASGSSVGGSSRRDISSGARRAPICRCERRSGCPSSSRCSVPATAGSGVSWRIRRPGS